MREREPDSIQTVYLFGVNVVCFYFKPRSEYVIEVDRTFRLKIAAIFHVFKCPLNSKLSGVLPNFEDLCP